MNQRDYVSSDIDVSKLLRTQKGLRLDAKVAYKEGWAMLTVYGFWLDTVTGRIGHTHKVVLQRVFVPVDTPKAEKLRMLRVMCELFAVRHDVPYYLRSKLS